MVFESPDSSFGCVDSVFLRWYPLKTDPIFLESFLQILRTFVVKDVEVGCMPLVHQRLVSRFPGVTDAGRFSVWYGNGMNGVSVLVI